MQSYYLKIMSFCEGFVTLLMYANRLSSYLRPGHINVSSQTLSKTVCVQTLKICIRNQKGYNFVVTTKELPKVIITDTHHAN